MLRSFIREAVVHPDGLLIRYSPFLLTEGREHDKGAGALLRLPPDELPRALR